MHLKRSLIPVWGANKQTNKQVATECWKYNSISVKFAKTLGGKYQKSTRKICSAKVKQQKYWLMVKWAMRHAHLQTFLLTHITFTETQ